MANVYAVKSGNWSDTTVWNTGALPTSADDVYANNFTVNIDTIVTVVRVSNGSATGIAAGGTFVPKNGSSLTCTTNSNITPGAASAVFSPSLSSGESCSISVSVLLGGSAAANAPALSYSGAGTINLSASIIGGSSGISGVLVSSGTFNLIGSTTGSSTQQGPGITASGNVNVNITGTITGSSAQAGSGIVFTSNGTLNITGTVTGGTGSTSGSAQAVTHSSTGIVNITGTIYGSPSGGSNYGISVTGSGYLIHTGTVQASSLSPSVQITSASSICTFTGPFLTTATGINPVIAVRWFWANSNVTPTYYQIRTQDLATIRPLYTADSVGGNPAVSNVRSGTVFGPNSELTGTMRVPPAASVGYGVSVDNTIGTASLNVADIWNYPISGITTSGSIGERLKNSATVSSIGTILSNALR